MKKVLMIGLAMALFMACKDTAPRYASASPEIDLVKALAKDYEEGNWESWKTHYADTVKIRHNSTEPINADALQEQLMTSIGIMSAYGFQEKEQFYEMVIDDQGEKWVNFWANWEGTVAETGQKLVIPVHLTVQVAGGKIVEEHGYYDMSQLMAVMNALAAAKMAAEEAMTETE